jgi:hypothetical protein
MISASTDFLAGGEINNSIHSAESKLVIRGKTWLFAPGSSIVRLLQKPPSLAKVNTDSTISRYHIRGLKLTSAGQEISLGGVVSTDRLDMMNVDIRNLSIKNILEVLDNKLDIGGVCEICHIRGPQPAFGATGDLWQRRNRQFPLWPC